MQAAAPPMPIPKRSRRRWYLVGGFVIVLLATPFLYILVVSQLREYELEQIYAAMDAEDPHWRSADLIKQLPAPPPDERNAMVQVLKVSGLMKQTSFRPGPFGYKLPAPINARLKDAEEQRLRAALAALAPQVLEEAYKIKDMPEGQIKIDSSTSSLDVNRHGLEIVNVTGVLQHDAMMHAHDGKMDEAADACLAITRSAHSIGDFPSFVGQMIRTIGQQDAVAAIERTLGQGILEEKRCEVIQDALTIEANHKGTYHALCGERAGAHDLFLALRDGKISSRKISEDMGLRVTPVGALHSYFPGLLLRGYPERLRKQNAMLRASQLNDEARTEAFHKLQDKAPDTNNPFNLGTYFILQNLDAERSRTVRVRCAVAALAVERYRLRFNDWPMNAAELVKEGLLKEWPKDVFDGQPLRFRRTETGFVVYSVGEDKIDNLGKIDRDNPPAPGTDVGFELWLPLWRATPALAEEEVPMK